LTAARPARLTAARPVRLTAARPVRPLDYPSRVRRSPPGRPSTAQPTDPNRQLTMSKTKTRPRPLRPPRRLPGPL